MLSRVLSLLVACSTLNGCMYISHTYGQVKAGLFPPEEKIIREAHRAPVDQNSVKTDIRQISGKANATVNGQSPNAVREVLTVNPGMVITPLGGDSASAAPAPMPPMMAARAPVPPMPQQGMMPPRAMPSQGMPPFPPAGRGSAGGPGSMTEDYPEVKF